MSEDDSLVEEFFSEVNDKYYPQVLEGIDLLDEQQIEAGIEILSRPLHTIKGVTGFMSGFEPASAFTHKVESFLKKMQAGEVEHKLPQIALAIESVNAIFILIEQLRETGTYDQETTDDIESRLSGEGSETGGSTADTTIPVELETADMLDIMTVKTKRLYHPKQLEAVKDILDGIESSKNIMVDFESAQSVGSSFFELLAAYSGTRDIIICEMNGNCMSTFYSWGFQKYFTVYPDRDSYLN